MNISEAFNFIDICAKRGYVLGLDNMTETLAALGNPEKKFEVIHVAGTNGKGSTSSYIQSVLREQGYRVGLFTSPAIISFFDRIKIDGEEIGQDDFLDIIEKVKNITETKHINITEFELITVIALEYFASKDCDFVVLEVGMGGRLDATNAVESKICSVITHIGLDHVEYLGDTVDKIAYEKAGIIKENTPVVLYDQDDNVVDVVSRIAKEKGSKLVKADFSQLVIRERKPFETVFDYKEHKGCKIKLLGDHQPKNAAVALEVLQVLIESGVVITRESIVNGLYNASIKGRLEVVNEVPMILFDGAHNVQGMKALSKSLRNLFPGRRFVFMLGFLKDKNYMSSVDVIAPITKGFITVEPDNPERKLSSNMLAEFLGMYSDRVDNCITVEKGLDFAIKNYKDDIIVIAGSFYMAKAVNDYFKGERDGL